jgi:hypothetical protein
MGSNAANIREQLTQRLHFTDACVDPAQHHHAIVTRPRER